MKEKNKKKQIAKITVFITSIFVIFMSITYAFVSQVLTGTKEVVINAGVLDLVLEEENEITISDALPMFDQVGMIQEESFNFKLINKGEMPTNYQLKLVDISTGNSLSKNIVRYGLTKNGNTTIDYLSTPYMGIVDSGIIEKGETYNYKLRLWISDKVVDESKIANKSLSLKIEVKTGQLDEIKYQEPMLVKGSTFNNSIPSTATSVVFTDKKAPETLEDGTVVSLTDVSEANNGSVVSWMDGTTMYVSSQKKDVKVIANTDCSGMFNQKQALTDIDFTYFDTSIVTNMKDMFRLCTNLVSLDLSNWDVSNVTSMYRMFAGTSDSKMNLQRLNVSGWDTSKVTDFSALVQECPKLTTLDVGDWDIGQANSLQNMFKGCEKLTTLDVSSWNTRNVKNMRSMFNGCKSLGFLDVSGWNTAEVTTMQQMFYSCISLETLDVSKWDVRKVTSMKGMFNGAGSNVGDMKISVLDVSSWKTDSLTDTSYMFYGCGQLTELNFSSWDVSKVTTMTHMFTDCFKMENYNFSNWNTSAVTDLSAIFNDNRSLVSIDVSDFDTGSVINMTQIFENCGKLETIIGLDKWDTSSNNTLQETFAGCSNLLEVDLSSWDTSSVYYIYRMFDGCRNLKTIYVSDKWSTESLQTGQFSNAPVGFCDKVFYGCVKLVGGQGTAYENERVDYTTILDDRIYTKIDGGMQSPGYLTKK